MLQSLLSLWALIASGVLLAVVGLAGMHLKARPGRRDSEEWVVGALAIALAGYVVFWMGFAVPVLGRVVACALVAGAAWFCIRHRQETLRRLREHGAVLLMGGLVALFYWGLIHLHVTGGWSDSIVARLPSMPADNALPRELADFIDRGNRNRILNTDWLVSDRPPLQSGVALLVMPCLRTAGISFDTVCEAVGLWLQLFWIPALVRLLDSLGLTRGRSLAVAGMVAFTGFFFFNSIYVWPKLDAAAFAVLAFVEMFLVPASEPDEVLRERFRRGGAAAVAAWLLHGGVMFAFLGSAPLVLWAWRRWKLWLLAGATFVAGAAPWLAYQHWYAPPANRLVKWHIGGVVPPDNRTVSQTLRDQYRQVGWKGAWETRRHNLQMLENGLWIFQPGPGPLKDRDRWGANDVAFPTGTASVWWLGLFALPLAVWACWRKGAAGRQALQWQAITVTALLGTVTMWLALMFAPDALFTHQGTYVTQMLLVGLLAGWAMVAHPAIFWVIAALQVGEFAVIWVNPSSYGAVPLNPLGVAGAAIAAAGIVGAALWFSWRKAPAPPPLS